MNSVFSVSSVVKAPGSTPFPGPRAPGSEPRILIVRLGSLGDIIHAVPVAAALREAFPAARIDWVVEPRHRELLDLVPVIDRRLVVPGLGSDTSWTGSWRGLCGGIRTLRRARYDVVIDLQGLLKSAVLARSAGAPRVIGFSRSHLRERAASLFYTEACDPGDAVHVVRKNLSVLSRFGVSPAAPRFPIDAPRSAVPEFVREQLPGASSGRFALLNPCAAWPNKRWPADRFGAVAADLRERHGLSSAVLWGPAEQAIAEALVGASRGAAMALPPTNIGDVVALARAATVMVSGDTGPLHIAAAVGTPIVGLFGPTSPERNGPWASGDITISRFAACSCHYQRRCRSRRECLADITVDDVTAALDRRLSTIATHA